MRSGLDRRAFTRIRALPSVRLRNHTEAPPLAHLDELRNSVLGQSFEDLQHVPQLEHGLEGQLAHGTQLAQVRGAPHLALAIRTPLARVQQTSAGAGNTAGVGEKCSITGDWDTAGAGAINSRRWRWKHGWCW